MWWVQVLLRPSLRISYFPTRVGAQGRKVFASYRYSARLYFLSTEIWWSPPNSRNHIFTENLAFLKIIPLAQISKQSCSKLNCAVRIYIYKFKYMQEALGVEKKKSRQNAECRMHASYHKKSFVFSPRFQNSVEVLFLLLFNKIVYLSLQEVKEASVTLPSNLLLTHWKITTFPTG